MLPTSTRGLDYPCACHCWSQSPCLWNWNRADSLPCETWQTEHSGAVVRRKKGLGLWLCSSPLEAQTQPFPEHSPAQCLQFFVTSGTWAERSICSQVRLTLVWKGKQPSSDRLAPLASCLLSEPTPSHSPSQFPVEQVFLDVMSSCVQVTSVRNPFSANLVWCLCFHLPLPCPLLQSTAQELLAWSSFIINIKLRYPGFPRSAEF